MKKLLLLFLFVAVSLCGCSGENRPHDLPRLYPLTLTIMVDDLPLDDAQVLLITDNPADAKWTVGGRTDAEGKAVIVTHGQFRGAPAGKFKVCVAKDDVAQPKNIAASEAPPMYDVNASPVSTPVIHHVDPIFKDPTSTPLEIEVVSTKKTTNLTLTVRKPE